MSSAIISAWWASQPILLLSSFVPITSGQALFTGETTGKGVRSVFVAATASAVRDFTIPANFWTAYTQGVHGRVDAFALYGNLTVFGQTQHYGGLGSNIGILRRSRHRVDAALLNFITTPFNRRDQAATVSVTLAPIVSSPLRFGNFEMTLYGGYLRSEFLGRRVGKLFSPPKGTHNGIVGAVIPLSKSASIIAEFDPGDAQQNVGLALLYLFPKK